jgi:hypothetical protein
LAVSHSGKTTVCDHIPLLSLAYDGIQDTECSWCSKIKLVEVSAIFDDDRHKLERGNPGTTMKYVTEYSLVLVKG